MELPERVHQTNTCSRIGASLIWGEAERAGNVYTGEERAWRGLINVYKCLKRVYIEKEARLFLVVLSDRQEAVAKLKHGVLTKDKETLVYCEGG